MVAGEASGESAMTPLVREFASAIDPSRTEIDATEYQWFDITNSVNNYVKWVADIRNVIDCNMPFEKVAIVGQVGATKAMVTAMGKNFEEGIAITGIVINGAAVEGVPVLMYKVQDGELVFLTKEMLDYEKARREGKELPYPEAKPQTKSAIRCASYVAELLRTLRHEPMTGYVPVEKKGFISTKRKAKGKPPLYDWTTVVIGPIKPRSEHKGGTHASPRQHDVRGHWVKNKHGKTFWRKPHKRGNAANGTIFHDYEVKAA
jgi:hypothetical protein